tara:strand:+ start:101 stop:739 length:639 start_codon:yes stop_codon:yes gene_type:complete
LIKPPNSKASRKVTSLKSGVKLGLMKKLSLYVFLVLLWCNVSQAGSIKDYEKGGMKLGKSLLELMTYEEIAEGLRPITGGNDYMATLYIPNIFTYPDEVGLYMVVFKKDDENFIIHGFYLFEQYPNDFAGCMKKQDEYMKANKKLFNLNPVDYGIKPKPSGPGKWRAVIFEYTPKKETSSILCYHFEDDPERNNLKMGVLTRELADHIMTPM